MRYKLSNYISMKRLFTVLWSAVFLAGILCSCNSKPEKATLTIYCTTDVHGSLFDYDLKKDSPTMNSLAGVAGYLKQEEAGGKKYILLDGGDILQGQPTNYYFNFIDTVQMNITAQIMNYMGYDAAAVGNHDIEAGHPVYDKVVKEFQFPWLAANAIDTKTGKPYFKPYTVIERDGLKIAVLGLITPGIPKWLPNHLWDGLEFEDMIETAQKWVPIIREKEKPDVLIGLFHSGTNYNYAGENKNSPRNENATMLVAEQVDGFDVIISGHDHQEKVEEITNQAGHKVLIVDPRSHARALGKITVELSRQGDGYEKQYTAELIDPAKVAHDSAYIRKFTPALNEVKGYIDTRIGEFTETLSGREGLFGPSAFTDFIHNAQLRTTGADISFSTVLQMDARIDKGDITIRDMFNLYKYENGLYMMKFTGNEIDKYLEYAYALQYNTMTSPKDHLLNFKKDEKGEPLRNQRGNYMLAADYFNYSCAAGIKYTVDITREPGNRVEISAFSDGRAFHPDSTYTVAINSYRGNGGGGHLTQGVGLTKEEIANRIVKIWDKDVRYYITEYIKEKEVLTPKCRNDWQVIPPALFNAGKERDYGMLYEGH